MEMDKTGEAISGEYGAFARILAHLGRSDPRNLTWLQY